MPTFSYQAKTEKSHNLDWGTLRQKQYVFPNGSFYYQEEALFSQSSPQPEILWQRNYPSSKVILRYYDSEQEQWVIQNNPSGILPEQTLFLTVEGSKENFYNPVYLIISQPLAYASRSNHSLEYFAENNGQVSLTSNSSGLTLTIQAAPQADRQIEYWVLQSSQELGDWNNPQLLALWPDCFLNDNHRFNYDGYYYISPYNYQPTGENYYYRMPSPYIVTKYINELNTVATDMLGIAMLDIMLPLQNTSGYFPTAPSSEWLEKAYGIGANFYDTRFSTEAAQVYLAAYQKFGIEKFGQASQKYGKFLLNYASKHHFQILGSDGQIGWLVEDYWSPQAVTPTHCSLNHQINEIRYLYDLASVNQQREYQELANQMLLGIKLSCSEWILPDNNLVYALLSDHSTLGTDYPYLTYNDLFLLQQALSKYQGKKDPDLQILMEHKLLWMQKNQIDGYYYE
ncbi:MAG: hypothetical protein MJ157_03705 [Clostridia bacterium]|nr:hypothetical protein [Clostridia bacterium]